MGKIFKEGDRVFHIEYGWGEVLNETNNDLISVEFDNGTIAIFDENGKHKIGAIHPTLSFTEYTLQGFSQERPIDLPEVGEEVMVSWNGDQWSLGKFHEYKNGVFYTIDDKRTWMWNHLKRIR